MDGAAFFHLFSSQLSSCVMPPFVYVEVIVLKTKVTSSSGGSSAVAGLIVSLTNCFTEATGPSLIATE